MQWHFLLMEGLVGQQQMVVSRLVGLLGAVGSGGAKEVAEDEPENGTGVEDGAEEDGQQSKGKERAL
ncbi:hypothetical protein ID866_8980 [Astraeus odoratus]|nr:hypothetical protein ID866_8980 [Astraeus odoratus]